MMFEIDFESKATPENIKKIEDCETKNAKKNYLDKQFQDLMEGQKYDYNKGISGIGYPNSSEYRDLLLMINKTNPLKGSLNCSLLIATFMNMPRTTEEEIQTANTTLREAIECSEREDLPFQKQGCDL